jgi:hypothetical protein
VVQLLNTFTFPPARCAKAKQQLPYSFTGAWLRPLLFILAVSRFHAIPGFEHRIHHTQVYLVLWFNIQISSRPGEKIRLQVLDPTRPFFTPDIDHQQSHNPRSSH